ENLEKNRSTLFMVPEEAPTPIAKGAFVSRLLSPIGDWLGSSMPSGFLRLSRLSAWVPVIADCEPLQQNIGKIGWRPARSPAAGIGSTARADHMGARVPKASP